MRAKPMMLFMIALACGLVASISVSQYLETSTEQQAPPVEVAKIYVAMNDIAIGDKLDAQNVKLEDWPKDKIPEGAITNLDDLGDKFTRTRLYAGEPILRAKLMDRNDGQSQSIKIPEGHRVVSVKVDIEAGLSGLLQPGDRVDLVLVMKRSSESPETAAKTILKDVNVFAVDAETDRSVDNEGRQIMAKTVSLLVKPPQVEAVMLAAELGKLQLSLRRPNDVAEDSAEGTTVSELLGMKGERGEDRAPAGGEGKEPPAFMKWLNENQTAQLPQPPPPVDPEPVAQPPALEPVKPAWTMEVFSPTGRQRFEWQNPQEAPREVLESATPAPAAVVPPPLDPLPADGAQSRLETPRRILDNGSSRRRGTAMRFQSYGGELR